MAYALTNDRGRAAPYPAYTYSTNSNSNNYNNFNSSNIDGSLSPSTNLGLRKRDGVAIIISLLLLRLAFTPPSSSDGGISSSFAAGGDSSIRVSMELAFYSPFQSTPPNLLNLNDKQKRSKKRILFFLIPVPFAIYRILNFILILVRLRKCVPIMIA